MTYSVSQGLKAAVFVGRVEQLTALNAAWERVGQGQPATVLIIAGWGRPQCHHNVLLPGVIWAHRRRPGLADRHAPAIARA
jgi:hypothetical protein